MTHLTGGPRRSVLASLLKLSEALVLLLFWVGFVSNVLLLPAHALNHYPCPFTFTLDGYWTLVGLLTLSGTSPIGADPLFSLPRTTLERRVLTLFQGIVHHSTVLPVPIGTFKHPPYHFSLSFNAYWTLVGSLPLSHTPLVGPDSLS